VIGGGCYFKHCVEIRGASLCKSLVVFHSFCRFSICIFVCLFITLVFSYELCAV